MQKTRNEESPTRRKREALWSSVAVAALLFTGVVTADQAIVTAGPKVTVYKTPTCGCCKKWVSHLEANGFEVEAIDRQDLGMIKSMSGVSPENASCHTARVGGYVVEGHVPADDIKRMLQERPDIKGLTVPGMPMGSPGMEGPRKDAYDVLTINNDGSSDVYARR